MDRGRALNARTDADPSDAPRHEAALRFVDLFAGFEAGLLEVDHAGRVVAANTAFCELVGRELGEVVGAVPPYAWWAPDQRSWFTAQLRMSFESAAARGTFEGDYLLPDGERVHIMGGVTVVREVDHEYLLFAVRDARSLRSAARAFMGDGETLSLDELELEAALRALFESNIVGIIAGEGERIVTANDAFLSMIGYTHDDLQSGGIDWPDLTPPEYLDLDATAGEEMLRAGRSGPVEKQYVHRDGHPVWVRIAGAAIQWDPFRWLSFVEDVTEQRAAEAERAEAELALATRTEALAAANALLDRIARRVTHDLKNPLTTLAGYFSLLERGIDDEETAAEVRDRIRSALERLNTLVGDLTRIAELETMELRAEDVPLNEMMGSIAELVEPQLVQTGGQLVHDDLPVVRGDRAGLQRVIHNLVANAVTHRRPDRPPRVGVRIDEDARSWLVSVVDDGPGIPPEDRSRIFEYGTRGREAPMGGEGIGLAAARAIVEAHGGRIWLDDEWPEPGTRIVFSIPRAEPER